MITEVESRDKIISKADDVISRLNEELKKSKGHRQSSLSKGCANEILVVGKLYFDGAALRRKIVTRASGLMGETSVQ
jgi:hypothetical protein